MIIWLTIQLFQHMFGVKITDEPQALLYTFGFIEMIAEIVWFVVVLFIIVYAAINDKYSKN